MYVKQASRDKASAAWFEASITWRGDAGSFGEPALPAPNGAPKGELIFMVFTLDIRKRPLGHCTPKRARQLIEKGRACVYRYFPFTIILKDIDVRTMDIHHNYRIKIDPGSIYTGIAVTENDRVIAYFEIQHRAANIVDKLNTRKNVRRNRRQREARYRRCKFRKCGKYETPREKDWLPPSQKSIADNVIHFVEKLERILGPCYIDIELVKFDMQLLENSDIVGLEYQQGTLFGYEMKAYLKENYQHTCQYCGGETGDRRLEWEHKIPKSRGGSNSVKNATLACGTCNSMKSNRTPEEWLAELKNLKKPSKLDEIRIKCLENMAAGKKVGQNLRYAAWSNMLRWHLFWRLSMLSADGKVTVGTGGKTAYNRKAIGLPKAHHLDALCCADVPEKGYKDALQPYLIVKAMGRGTRLLGQTNKCGIITVKYKNHHKRVDGLQTGDIVYAVVPDGKYKGAYTGRIMIRSRGSHDIRSMNGTRFSMTKNAAIHVLQHIDGYQYSFEQAIPLGN